MTDTDHQLDPEAKKVAETITAWGVRWQQQFDRAERAEAEVERLELREGHCMKWHRSDDEVERLQADNERLERALTSATDDVLMLTRAASPTPTGGPVTATDDTQRLIEAGAMYAELEERHRGALDKIAELGAEVERLQARLAALDPTSEGP